MNIALVCVSDFVGSRLIIELGYEKWMDLDKWQSYIYSALTTLHDIRYEGIVRQVETDQEVIVREVSSSLDDELHYWQML